METCKILVDRIEWHSPGPGVRFKVVRDESKQVRLVEFTPEFVEAEWCTKGHVGIVLSGELAIDFSGDVVRFPEGSALLIPEGARHAHKARAITPVVRLFLVEDVSDEPRIVPMPRAERMSDSHSEIAMYRPRRIETSPDWLDQDGVKLYTISATGKEVSHSSFLPRLQEVKAKRAVDWPATPAFAIFHEGATALYLVLAWWGNDNEMFTSVSVREGDQWIEDASRYSFCLWDLEIMWAERVIFVDVMYSGRADLQAYRRGRLMQLPL